MRGKDKWVNRRSISLSVTHFESPSTSLTLNLSCSLSLSLSFFLSLYLSLCLSLSHSLSISLSDSLFFSLSVSLSPTLSLFFLSFSLPFLSYSIYHLPLTSSSLLVSWIFNVRMLSLDDFKKIKIKNKK